MKNGKFKYRGKTVYYRVLKEGLYAFLQLRSPGKSWTEHWVDMHLHNFNMKSIRENARIHYGNY